MFTAILYGVAGTGLIISFFKDRKKTKMALKKHGSPLKIFYRNFYRFWSLSVLHWQS